MVQSKVNRPAADWHNTRRHQMMKAHPELAKLYGRNPVTILVALTNLTLHTLVAITVAQYSWWWAVAAAFLVGALFENISFAVVHEFMHKTSITSKFWNQFLMTFSATASPNRWGNGYRYRHGSHHLNQGSFEKNDFDEYIDNEHNMLKMYEQPKTVGRNALMVGLSRMLRANYSIAVYVLNWALFTHFVYVGKFFSGLIKGNLRDVYRDGFIETVTKAMFFAGVFYYGGWSSILYLYLSFAFFMGFMFHPFLAFWTIAHSSNDLLKSKEYVSSGYIDYGPVMNFLTLNITYHCEHHDFPQIPWNHLHKIKKIAPEYYGSEVIPQSKNFLSLMGTYFFDQSIAWAYEVRSPLYAQKAIPINAKKTNDSGESTDRHYDRTGSTD